MLSSAHQEGLAKRKIDLSVAISMGLYSGTRSSDGSVEADPDGKVLCFPYIEDGIEVNTKMRWMQDGEKRFGQIPGRTKTFFNADILFDEENLMTLETGVEGLLITEGEFDAITAIQCGYPLTVSVPDGAPPARTKDGRLIEVPEDTRDLDPESDVKYSYIGHLWDRLDRVKTFIIATDGDEPGGRLAKELARRLGAAKCFWVEYPKIDCVPCGEGKMRAPKDLNEVLMYLGPEAVEHTIQNAKPWPVKNLYRFQDFPDLGDPITYPTHLSPALDEIFRPYPGAFIVTTGIPNMGKSEVVKQIMVNMAKHHGWVSVYFPGEEPVKPYLENSLKTKFLMKPKARWDDDDRKKSDEFLDRYFRIVTHDPTTADEEGEIDVDFLIDKAITAVHRDGAKLLVIDPWNELAHNHDRKMMLTEYVGESIRKLKRFARNYDCAVWVVAHPKKVDGRPGLYDISDSAHWANKPDLALIVDAEDATGTLRDIIIPKVRFKAAGRKGQVKMEFDRDLEVYVPYDLE